MNIPFYNDTGHGLYWTAERLCWVCLRRSGSRVRVENVWTIPIRDGREDDALLRLVERVQPSQTHVATHVAPALVRCVAAPVDPYGDYEAWLDEQVRGMLPPNVPASDFVTRTRPLAGGEEDRVLIATTRRHAVEARCEQLESAGLTAVVMGDVRLDIGFSYAYDPRFAPGDATVLLDIDRRVWRLSCRDGHLTDVPDVQPTSRLADALHDAALVEDGPPVFGAGGQDMPDPSVRTGPRPVYLNAHIEGVESDEGMLRARDIPAMGLAVKQLFPDADTLNFLPPPVVADAQDARDREQAMQTILGLGALVALLLAVATLATMVTDGWTEDVLADQADLNAQLQTVESAERELDALRDRLQKSRRLFRQRTHTALLLQHVGQAVPDGVWLDALTVGRVEPSASEASVHLVGYTDEDAPIARFLSSLERASDTRDVRLIQSERLDAEGVARATGLTAPSLHQFDVRLRYPLTP